MAKETASIHIDKRQYHSPDPTIGSALYTLGGVDPNVYDLYRESRGPGDDELIPNDTTSIDLKNGDHFFSAKKKLNPGGAPCL